jgi:hypothetical protein
MRYTTFIIATLLLTACTRTPVYVTQPLPLPDRPDLPTLQASELQCLTDDAYSRLVTRDLLLRQYGEQCEAVIKSTWEDQ